MIGFFLKYWQNFLNALLLIAVIVLVFLWNPFNIFGSGLRLQPTANLISNVRSIGQLVTAEYYGEVVASLDEARLNLIEKDYLNERAEDIYGDLKHRAFDEHILSVLNNFSEEEMKKNKNNVDKLIRQACKDYVRVYDEQKNDTADVVLIFLGKHLFNQKIDKKKFKKEKDRTKIRKKNLEYLFYYVKLKYNTLSENQFFNFLNQGFETTNSYTDYFYEVTESLKSKQEQKKNLAMIGRGWVKAGFDFSRLDERRFTYDKNNETIHLFGIRPQILDTDINPWFIPERKIPGFDILTSQKVDFEDAIVVKSYCKRKLKMYAMEANILQQAKEYGEEVIKELFSLLSGDEIRAVRFHSDILSTVYNQVGKDSLITIDELPLIDSTYSNYLNSIKKSENDKTLTQQKNRLLTEFLSDLRKLPFEFQKTRAPFNYFTRNLQTVLKDTVIELQEYKFLRDTLRWKIKKALYWKILEDSLASNTKKDSLLWKLKENSSIWKNDKETSWWKFSEDSSHWKIENDTTLCLKFYGDTLQYLVTHHVLLWKTDSTFIPEEYQRAKHWFDDSLSFIADYDSLINGVIKHSKGIYSLSHHTIQRDSIDKFEAMIADDNVLEYNTIGDKILIKRIDDRLHKAVAITKLKELYYNLNIDQDKITKAIEQDSFDVTLDDFKGYTDFTNSDLQTKELAVFINFLHSKHKLYHDRAWVVKASKQFKEKYLNKEKINNIGTSIKEQLRALKQRF